MGLAGRKIKQRIGADPRNLTWSDDSSKFGAKYLQSLGWTSGTGLGVSGEGRTNNLEIHQKLDLMGIGANRRGPGGDDAGWRGGREFEGLLARLNQAQDEDTKDMLLDSESVPEGQDSANVQRQGDSKKPEKAQGSSMGSDIDLEEVQRTKKGEAGEKKRKRSTDDVDSKEAKRKRKEEKKEKKSSKKVAKKLKACQDSDNDVQVAKPVTEQMTDKVSGAVTKVSPRYRAHRARHLASKRLAASSQSGMNEILGIPSSTSPRQILGGTSTIPFPSQVTPPRQHSIMNHVDQDGAPGIGLARVKNRMEQSATQISMMGLGARSVSSAGLGTQKATAEESSQQHCGQDLLRRGGKSVAEYFAEKMRMKNTVAK